MTRIGSASVSRTILPLLVASLILGLGVSCKKKSSWLKDDIRYFKDMLTADMDYDDLVEEFGEPVDLNAAFAESDGLHVYQYPLYDTTFVRIGYRDKIVYVCLVDDRNNVVEDILTIDQNGN
jgi:hypothetical protein